MKFFIRRKIHILHDIAFIGAIIFFLSKLCASTFFETIFNFPWNYLEILGLFLAFLPFIRISPNRLLFFLPFLFVVTISVFLNSIDLKRPGINTYIVTLFVILILSWRKTLLQKKDVELIGKIIIFFVLSCTISEYVLKYSSFRLGIDFNLYKASFGFFPNRNTAAMALFFSFVISPKIFKNTIFRLIILFLIFYLIVMTGSRASFLGVIIIIFINSVKFLFRMLDDYSIKKYALALFFLLIVFFIISSSYWMAEVEKMYQRTLSGGTTHRTEIWNDVIYSTFENIKYVIFGSGPSSIAYDISAHEIIRYPIENIGLSSHNSFVQAFAWYGLSGIISIFILLIHLFFRIRDIGVFWGILSIGLFETELFVGNSILWSLIIYLCIYRDSVLYYHQKGSYT
jgi:O-antigen ligase